MATNSRFESQPQPSSIFIPNPLPSTTHFRTDTCQFSSSNQRELAIKRRVLISRSLCEIGAGIESCDYRYETNLNNSGRLKFSDDKTLYSIGTSEACAKYELAAQSPFAEGICSKSSDGHESSSWNSDNSDRLQQISTSKTIAATMQTTTCKLRERLFRVISKVPVQVESIDPLESMSSGIEATGEVSSQLGKSDSGIRTNDRTGAKVYPKRRQQLNCAEPVLIKYYNDKSLEEILELHFKCSLMEKEPVYIGEEPNLEGPVPKIGPNNSKNSDQQLISNNSGNQAGSGSQSLLLGSSNWLVASYTGNQMNISTMTMPPNGTANSGSCCSQATPIDKFNGQTLRIIKSKRKLETSSKAQTSTSSVKLERNKNSASSTFATPVQWRDADHTSIYPYPQEQDMLKTQISDDKTSNTRFRQSKRIANEPPVGMIDRVEEQSSSWSTATSSSTIEQKPYSSDIYQHINDQTCPPQVSPSYPTYSTESRCQLAVNPCTTLNSGRDSTLGLQQSPHCTYQHHPISSSTESTQSISYAMCHPSETCSHPQVSVAPTRASESCYDLGGAFAPLNQVYYASVDYGSDGNQSTITSARSNFADSQRNFQPYNSMTQETEAVWQRQAMLGNRMIGLQTQTIAGNNMYHNAPESEDGPLPTDLALTSHAHIQPPTTSSSVDPYLSPQVAPTMLVCAQPTTSVTAPALQVTGTYSVGQTPLEHQCASSSGDSINNNQPYTMIYATTSGPASTDLSLLGCMESQQAQMQLRQHQHHHLHLLEHQASVAPSGYDAVAQVHLSHGPQ